MGMQAGPGAICARCHDDYWQLSGRGWCLPCEKSVHAAETLRAIAHDLGPVAGLAGEYSPWNPYRVVQFLLDHADRQEAWMTSRSGRCASGDHLDCSGHVGCLCMCHAELPFESEGL